ncbi:MAG: ATP-binding cassette domain-containing protein, partial [Proteobacteria bacterium]|nr:ATP-binding cassette domain-containing protein [Pseudomonadota bacterium]
MSTIIEIEGVSKFFGGVVANKEVSMSVKQGGITGLIGPNGSGKTTLFNSVVGYHPIDGGSIKFENKEISKLPVQQIARLGLLRTFQQTRIYGAMNCVQNMLISLPHRKMSLWDAMKVNTKEDYERADRLLEFVGLYEKRLLKSGDLSFGQQKLLEFAMALMNEPTCLLLDEPTAGINPTLINGLIDRLKRANAEFGITLFIIEHNMRVIMNMADTIYCLAHGELLAQGTPGEIQNDQRVIDAYLGAHLSVGESNVNDNNKASGYHGGGIDSVISVDEVTRQAAAIAEDISLEQLDELAGNAPHVSINNLVAGYGQMEILHNFNLRVGKAQSLCLIGPNGAGKSTI